MVVVSCPWVARSLGTQISSYAYHAKVATKLGNAYSGNGGF